MFMKCYVYSNFLTQNKLPIKKKPSSIRIYLHFLSKLMTELINE